MDRRLPGSSVHRIALARILDGLSPPSPGDLPDTGLEHMSPVSPALAGGFFPTEPPGKLVKEQTCPKIPRMIDFK